MLKPWHRCMNWSWRGLPCPFDLPAETHKLIEMGDDEMPDDFDTVQQPRFQEMEAHSPVAKRVARQVMVNMAAESVKAGWMKTGKMLEGASHHGVPYPGFVIPSPGVDSLFPGAPAVQFHRGTESYMDWSNAAKVALGVATAFMLLKAAKPAHATAAFLGAFQLQSAEISVAEAFSIEVKVSPMDELIKSLGGSTGPIGGGH